MKYLLSTLAFLVFCTPGFAADGKLGIAASVNDDIITTRDVDGRVAMAVQGANLPDDPTLIKALRKQALESLIDEQIRLQEAERLSALPSNEEVDAAFAKLAGQNNLKPEEFTAVLQRTPGMYSSVLQQIKTQIAWSNVVKKKIRPQVNITETDISTYLTEKEKNPAHIEYQIAEIFLKNTDTNQTLATQLVSELRNGSKRFSVLAKQFSQGLEAGKGGLLGWIPEGRLEKPLDDALSVTKAGDVTDPILSTRGIHILLMREKRDILPTKQGSQRLGIKQAVVPLPVSAEVPKEIEQKAEAQAKFFQSEAKDCATMDEMIKKIAHPLSRDIGQVRLADLPPAIARVVKDLPIGQASEPLRANDGYMVVMVCTRDENSDDSMREDIANTIGLERLNRLQYRYYRDLRAAAYVDIRQ